MGSRLRRPSCCRGLPAGETDLVLATVDTIYPDAADDALVKSVIDDLIEQQRDILGDALIDLLYLNYADISQDVFSSFGADNKATLQKVAKKYDPTGVFQIAAPGGFKLF